MSRHDFWTEVFKLHGSITPVIFGRLIGFTLFATVVAAFFDYLQVENGLAAAHYEFIGVVLALLLVLRTNSGYDRWYEARKIWGGIVNQSRNLAQIGLIYGPDDRQWRESYVRWCAAFSSVCRHSLRGEHSLDAIADLDPLVGPVETKRLSQAQHMPMYTTRRIGQLLKTAVNNNEMDRFFFLQAESERAQLMDHIGGCERILKTPLATVFSIKIRRFLFLYLMILPIATVDTLGWITPLVTMLVAYPLLALDQIGVELQNPFCRSRLSHLPLDDISTNIRNNLLESLEDLPELVPFDSEINRQVQRDEALSDTVDNRAQSKPSGRSHAEV